MDDIVLELKSISAGYDDKAVIKDVDLKIFKNDFLGIIGPNGGGKTTLLKVILGLLKPMSGELIFSQRNRKIGYLPQYHNNDKQFPISVYDVVASGLYTKNNFWNKLDSKDKNAISEVLEKVGMIEHKNKAIGDLSGGQIQRVFLARAVVSNPNLLILDEPNTYVDTAYTHKIYNLLNDFNNSMAIIMVSHDIGTISSYVKNIGCLNETLHYHSGSDIEEHIPNFYNCPIDIITHGKIPHRVLRDHSLQKKGES